MDTDGRPRRPAAPGGRDAARELDVHGRPRRRQVRPRRERRPSTGRSDPRRALGRPRAWRGDRRPHRAGQPHADAIRAVDGVRERGYDLHLHLVGSAAEAYRSYVDRVEAAVAAREHVTLERSVPRTRLEALLGSHRYGLNPKRGEHFGMALAEYVAAGMVPFAHDSGGQRDVVDGAEDRLFGTVTEATERLVAAIEADARPRLPRIGSPWTGSTSESAPQSTTAWPVAEPSPGLGSVDSEDV
ncbi:glycosyltransferase [Halomicroarcula sp. GCM10025709]|uniref:glycosyltransferase n=1 Tax=Halomicroarcula sp. GCM10025709 TaxID=3252669 RepID=UPI003615A918